METLVAIVSFGGLVIAWAILPLGLARTARATTRIEMAQAPHASELSGNLTPVSGTNAQVQYR